MDERTGNTSPEASSALPPPIAGASRGLTVFGISLAFFGALRLLTPGLIDPDEFFHVRFASLMRERGEIIRALPWAADTIHAESYRDHHFLQHVLYIPFAWGDLEIAARVIAALSAALMLTAFWGMARGWGWRAPALWAALLAGSATGFVIRQDMARVQNLCLAFLFLGQWAWKSNSRRTLFALAFANVWLYDGFLLLPGVCAVCALFSAAGERRNAWLGVAAALVGTAAGMVINPFLPDNFASYATNFSRVFESRESILPIGNEWEPAKWLDMGGDALPLNFALLVLLVWGMGRRVRPRGTEWGFLLVAAGLWALTWRHQRFVEYWPAPAVMFVAAYATRLGGSGRVPASSFQERSRDRRGLRGDREGASTVDRPVPSPTSGLVTRFRQAPWAFRLLAILAFAGCVGQFAGALWLMRARVIPDLGPACAWLRENTPPDTKVFNTCWWDFSPAFLHGPHNRFVVGLDLNYLRLHDPALARHYEEIVSGRERKPLAAIRDLFGCEYVLLDQQNVLLKFLIDVERGAIKEYEDSNRVVYRLK